LGASPLGHLAGESLATNHADRKETAVQRLRYILLTCLALLAIGGPSAEASTWPTDRTEIRVYGIERGALETVATGTMRCLIDASWTIDVAVYGPRYPATGSLTGDRCGPNQFVHFRVPLSPLVAWFYEDSADGSMRVSAYADVEHPESSLLERYGSFRGDVNVYHRSPDIPEWDPPLPTDVAVDHVLHGAIGTYASGYFRCLNGDNTGQFKLDVYLPTPDFLGRGELSGVCEHTEYQRFWIPISGVPASLSGTSVKAEAHVGIEYDSDRYGYVPATADFFADDVELELDW
jgi:hypothetical protein